MELGPSKIDGHSMSAVSHRNTFGLAQPQGKQFQSIFTLVGVNLIFNLSREITRLRNRNATDDPNIDERSFKNILHSKLEKLM